MTLRLQVRTRILERVAVAHSSPRHSAAGEGDNIATPHAPVNGTVRPVAPFLGNDTNPAGGIVSGAEDMVKWVIVHLDSGKVADGRLYSAATALGRPGWYLCLRP